MSSSAPNTGSRIGAELPTFTDGPSIYVFARSARSLNIDAMGLFELNFSQRAFQYYGTIRDFGRNYRDMRRANTINADKYFHCKANCQATQRGPYGESAACAILDIREAFDQYIKGDPVSASEADQTANRYSRTRAAQSSNQACGAFCSYYRPSGLSEKY